MRKNRDWEPYDPTWLVKLAKKQIPQERWLPEALMLCRRCLRDSQAYIYFVEPSRPNKPGSEWQFEDSFDLECPTEGWITIDILSDHRIGGIEFVDKIDKIKD